MSVYLTAIIKSKSGQESALKALLEQLTTNSQNEEACIQYDLHQSAEDEGLFIFHEEWAGQAGLDVHNNQPHLKKFLNDASSMLDGQVVIYKTNRV